MLEKYVLKKKKKKQVYGENTLKMILKYYITGN